MKRAVKLWTSAGRKVRIALENWGSGVDQTNRRWTLADGYWECLDSGEVAQKASRSGRKAFDSRNPVVQLSNVVANDEPDASGAHAAMTTSSRGQTMVEYAVIIAAIGVVAWSAYNLMGHDIVTMTSGVDSSLTSS